MPDTHVLEPKVRRPVQTVTEAIHRPPEWQAYKILHVGFIVAPILAGVDKFLDLMTDWTMYLTPLVPKILGMQARSFMYIVGVIEIFAGLVVAVKPRIGAYVVAAWLAGIIINLLTVPGFYDIALRDFGLMLGALALARLSRRFDPVVS